MTAPSLDDGASPAASLGATPKSPTMTPTALTHGAFGVSTWDGLDGPAVRAVRFYMLIRENLSE